MPDAELSGEPDLDAGGFGPWLSDMQSALLGDRDANVPCNGCTACCTSSQFVHIQPEETDTLRHIPAELLFPAPRLPPGHFVLGYDERGHCPMLIDNACSIYEHRPRTCRTYDCRVFPAAGVEIDEPDKAEIAKRIRRWRFTYADEADVVRHDAVREAAAFLRDNGDSLPEDARPRNPTQLAVFAVEMHERFLPGAADRYGLENAGSRASDDCASTDDGPGVDQS